LQVVFTDTVQTHLKPQRNYAAVIACLRRQRARGNQKQRAFGKKCERM